MSKISDPIDFFEAELENPAIDAVLREAGLKKDPTIKSTFDDAGASVENAANTISQVMAGGKNHEKLKAAEMTLKIHEVLENLEKEGGSAPKVQINVYTNGENNLINLLIPTVH